MTLYLFLLAAILAYVSLQYFVIPRLERKNATGAKTLSSSATLAVSKYLSTTAFLAAVTYLLFLAIIFALSLSNPVSANELGAAVGKIQWFQSKYKILREFWTVWLFLMLLLAFIAYRRDKKAAAGKHVIEPLPYLPPNEEMEEISRKITQCAERARRLEQSWVRTDGELRIRLNDLQRESEKLRVQLHDADLRRRVSLPPAAQESSIK